MIKKRYVEDINYPHYLSGHFSQLVWKSSNELGIGTAKSATGTKIIVANYNPPGNYLGKYVENVPHPISK